MNPEIVDYIRANWSRYTREAITAQLVAAGHDSAAIEEAWAAVVAEAEIAAGPNPWPRFWKAFALTALGGGVLIAVAWLSLWGDNYFGGGAAVFAVIFYGVALLVPLGLGVLILAIARKRVSADTLAGMAMWVPIVLVGLTAGTCVAMGSGA